MTAKAFDVELHPLIEHLCTGLSYGPNRILRAIPQIIQILHQVAGVHAHAEGAFAFQSHHVTFKQTRST